ncbi:hypothetical protein QBC32DRAFT_349954, partial [Pseudoneurospora amorphoporcata]
MTAIDLRASDDSSGESANDEAEVYQEQNRAPELFYQKLPGRTIDPKKLLALLKSKFGGELEDGQYTVSLVSGVYSVGSPRKLSHNEIALCQILRSINRQFVCLDLSSARDQEQLQAGLVVKCGRPPALESLA